MLIRMGGFKLEVVLLSSLFLVALYVVVYACSLVVLCGCVAIKCPLRMSVYEVKLGFPLPCWKQAPPSFEDGHFSATLLICLLLS